VIRHYRTARGVIIGVPAPGAALARLLEDGRARELTAAELEQRTLTQRRRP
jgi:hypothetical protein